MNFDFRSCDYSVDFFKNSFRGDYVMVVVSLVLRGSIWGHSRSTFVEERGGEVIEKRTKTNKGRGVLACVYDRFLKKKCWDFQNWVILQFFLLIIIAVWNIKACVRHFLSNFCFSTKWYPFQNYEKCFLFHQKSSFHSQDIQTYVIFSLPFHTF